MSGVKQVEENDDSWACFNPFLQDSIKHTELLERLAADADALYSDDYSEEKHSHPRGIDATAHDSVDISSFKHSFFTVSSPHMSPEDNGPSVTVSHTELHFSHPTVEVHNACSVPCDRPPVDLVVQTTEAVGAARDADHQSTLCPNPSRVQSVVNHTYEQPRGHHTRTTPLNDAHTAVTDRTRSIITTQSVLYELNSSGHTSVSAASQKTDQDIPTCPPNGFFSNPPQVLNVLQACSDPVPSHVNLEHEDVRHSRFLAQMCNETDSEEEGTPPRVMMFEISHTHPTCLNPKFLWETYIPDQHVATHMIMLRIPFDQKKLKQPHDTVSLHNREPNARSSMMHGCSSDSYCTPDQDAREKDSPSGTHEKAPLATTTNAHGRFTSADDHDLFELLSWFIILVTTHRRPSSTEDTLVSRRVSYLSILSASTGFAYINTVPLEGGVVAEVVYAHLLHASPSCQSTPHTPLPGRLGVFGLLSCFGKLHIFEIVNSSATSRVHAIGHRVSSSPRIRRQIIDLLPLQPKSGVHPHAITLLRTVENAMRVCILFSNGVAYCYNEHHVSYRLDSLSFSTSDFSHFVTRLPFTSTRALFPLSARGIHPCFSSLAALQQESWRLHYDTLRKSTSPDAQNTNAQLGDLLLQCIMSTSLMASVVKSSKLFPCTSRTVSDAFPFNNEEESVSTSKASKHATLCRPAQHFSVDHLLHQVQACALMASTHEFLCWLPVLCCRAVESGLLTIVCDIVHACIESVYKECKEDILYNTCRPVSWRSCAEDVMEASRDTWGSYNTVDPEMQPYTPDDTEGPTENPGLIASSDNFHEDYPGTVETQDTPWTKGVNGLVYWMHPRILRTMGLSAQNVFLHYVVKSIMPPSMWPAFQVTLDTSLSTQLYGCSSSTTPDTCDAERFQLDTASLSSLLKHTRDLVDTRGDHSSLLPKKVLDQFVHAFNDVKCNLSALRRSVLDNLYVLNLNDSADASDMIVDDNVNASQETVTGETARVDSQS